MKCKGDFCKFFKVGRSVRQGCGLSAVLYTLAAEPLHLICKNIALKCIEIENSTETDLPTYRRYHFNSGRLIIGVQYIQNI